MLRWSLFCFIFGLVLVFVGVAGLSGVAIETGKLLLATIAVLLISALVVWKRNQEDGGDPT